MSHNSMALLPYYHREGEGEGEGEGGGGWGRGSDSISARNRENERTSTVKRERERERVRTSQQETAREREREKESQRGQERSVLFPDSGSHSRDPRDTNEEGYRGLQRAEWAQNNCVTEGGARGGLEMDNPYVYVPHGSPTMTLSGRVSVARGAELGAFRWAGGEGGVETKCSRGSGYVTDTIGAHVGQHGKGAHSQVVYHGAKELYAAQDAYRTHEAYG